MTNRERVLGTKGLVMILGELFLITEDQAAQALLKNNISSWGDFKVQVALRAQAFEDAESKQEVAK